MGPCGNVCTVLAVIFSIVLSCLFRCQVDSVRTHLPKPHKFDENSRLVGSEQIGKGELIGPEDVVRSLEKSDVLFAGLAVSA